MQAHNKKGIDYLWKSHFHSKPISSLSIFDAHVFEIIVQ